MHVAVYQGPLFDREAHAPQGRVELLAGIEPGTKLYTADDEVVWTEGDTPEEYGKYYVRYMTDVGPRFCIAEWLEYDACVPNRNMVKAWVPDWSRSMNHLRRVTHFTHLPKFIE